MTVDNRCTYKRLLTTEPPWHDVSASIDHIGALIDLSADFGEADGARHAVDLCDKLRKWGPLSDENSALLYYFGSNAWSVVAPLSALSGADVWNWKDIANDNMIRLLRQAQRSPGFQLLGAQRRSEVFTNLGNALDTLGRSVEALEYYGQAIRISPEHGMARGNLGICLTHYGKMLPHLPHREGYCSTAAFLTRACEELKAALDLPLAPDPTKDFTTYLKHLEHLLEGAHSAQHLVASADVPGATDEERKYRDWVLSERLFLNPINDLDDIPEAARDILHLPPVVTESPQDPYIQSLFNQLKQEYVTARFLLYEGIITKAPHFADKEVTIVDTEDYTSHSLCLEKTRLAFRMAYSQFDKIAFLLNAYLKLGISPRKVSFRTLWYQGEDQKRDLKPTFQNKENWPLRGLFGLSRDLAATKDDRDCLDPDAQDLVQIRNHLEHKHLIIHAKSWVATGRRRGGETDDGSSFAIDRDDFESRTLRILKLARSAVIYLIHAIVSEEQIRTGNQISTYAIIPVVLHPIDDDSKS